MYNENAKLSLDLASGLFCYIPLHKIWYGIAIRALQEHEFPSPVFSYTTLGWHPRAAILASFRFIHCGIYLEMTDD